MSLNRHDIIGNLGQDPEVRATSGGDTAVTLNVATSERWKDKNTGEMKEKTCWHRVVFFGRMAEVCAEYLTKGSKVYISGPSETRKWQDKDGRDRYTTEIRGREMTMLDGREKGQGQGQQAQQRPPAPARPPQQQPPRAPVQPAAAEDGWGQDVPF